MHFKFDEILNTQTGQHEFTITHRWDAPEKGLLFYALSPKLAAALDIAWDDMWEMPVDANPKEVFYAALNDEICDDAPNGEVMLQHGLDHGKDLFVEATLTDETLAVDPAAEIGPYLFAMFAHELSETQRPFGLSEKDLGTLADEWWGLYRMPAEKLAEFQAEFKDETKS
ncbi:MAG TPA: hypothetical protein VGM95_05030 [Lactobacillaceae bacterium]